MFGFLPEEIQFEIFKFLSPKSLYKILQSCQSHFNIVIGYNLLEPFSLKAVVKIIKTKRNFTLGLINIMENYGHKLGQQHLRMILYHSCVRSDEKVIYSVLNLMDCESEMIAKTILSSGMVNIGSVVDHERVDGEQVMERMTRSSSLNAGFVSYILDHYEIPNETLMKIFEKCHTHFTFEQLMMIWHIKNGKSLVLDRLSGLKSLKKDEFITLIKKCKISERKQKWTCIRQFLGYETILLDRQLSKEFKETILNESMQDHKHNLVIKCLDSFRELVNQIDLSKFTETLILKRQIHLLTDLVYLYRLTIVTMLGPTSEEFLIHVFKRMNPLGKNISYLGIRSSSIFREMRYERDESGCVKLLRCIFKLYPSTEITKVEQSITKLSSTLLNEELKKFKIMQERDMVDEEQSIP